MARMRSPVTVADDEWLSGEEAARVIGVPPTRIRWLIMNGHLTPATRADGGGGVTRDSVDAEARWRKDASFGQRLRRLLGYAVTWSP